MDLSHTVISTPIDGVVISRNVDVGQTVAASFQAPVLFVIANDLRKMRVNASIDEADVGRVREGQDVLFHVDAFPERDFWGRVEQVRLNPTTVSNVVTYNAIVAVDNENLLLRPGMTATVSVQVRKAAEHAAPARGGAALPARGLRAPQRRSRVGPAALPGRAAALTRDGPVCQSRRLAPAGAAARPRPGPPEPGAGREGGAGERRGWSRPGGGERAGGRLARGGPQAPGNPASAGARAMARARRGPADDGLRTRSRRQAEQRHRWSVGISDGQYVELRDGLGEGTTVITGTEIPGAARAAVRGPAPRRPRTRSSRSSSAGSGRPMPEPLIRIADLRKSYALGDVTVHALRGVNIDIEAGAFLAIVGASGSGKSTLMNILGLLDRPTSGSYFLEGQDVSGFDRDRRAELRNRKIGFVFQNFSLLPRTTALENVELPLLYNGRGLPTKQRHQQALGLLKAVGLAERADHKPNQLSGGQQQRVAIARSLVNDPELILADEPTGNLDSRTSVEIMEILQRLNREQRITVILITHEHDIAEYAERVVNVRDGRVTSDQRVERRRDAARELASLPAPEQDTQ